MAPVAFQSLEPDQEIISLLCSMEGEIVRSNPVTASFSGTSRVRAVEVALGNAETEILVGVPIDVKFGSDSNSAVNTGEA